jgi:transcriptional regulator with PAS, ATPase and Fis domain
MPPAALTALFEPGHQPGDGLRPWLESVACVLSACLLTEQTVLARRMASTPDRGHAVTARGLLGHSEAMTMVRDRITRYAAATEPVSILGESGTGKELVARAIHRQSARGRGPFVAVNCGGLVGSLLEAEMFGIESGTATGVRGRKGKVELARGGTLFLDEVADLSPAGQAVLLRVLQEREVERVGADRPIPVDFRVVAATNQPLRQRVADQQFREDLYYRLQVLPLSMPPLRERAGDVVELACAFLDRDSRRWPWDLQPAAADVLAACDWPGNVRQLESVIALIRTLAPTPAIDVDLVHSALQGFEVPIPGQREPGPLDPARSRSAPRVGGPRGLPRQQESRVPPTGHQH